MQQNFETPEQKKLNKIQINFRGESERETK